MALKAEHVAAISAVGAGVGAVINEKVSSPITGSGIIPAVVGAAIAIISYMYIKMDGVGDFLEGFGIGMAIDALI